MHALIGIVGPGQSREFKSQTGPINRSAFPKLSLKVLPSTPVQAGQAKQAMT
jgi:hypothetical protein